MLALLSLAVLALTDATPTGGGDTLQMAPADPGACSYPANCPMKVLPRADKYAL